LGPLCKEKIAWFIPKANPHFNPVIAIKIGIRESFFNSPFFDMYPCLKKLHDIILLFPLKILIKTLAICAMG
jgi:hypothetical protein